MKHFTKLKKTCKYMTLATLALLGGTALSQNATAEGYPVTVRELGIIKDDGTINLGTHSKTDQAIILACKDDNDEELSALFNAGTIDANRTIDLEGYPLPILAIALEFKSLKCVTELLERGANPNFEQENLIPSMKFAVNQDNLPMAKILYHYGAELNPNYFDPRLQKNQTAFENAIMLDNETMVRWFISEGVDINTVNEDGITPLEISLILEHYTPPH